MITALFDENNEHNECYERVECCECITRLAPSPSGRMHAGNIFASLVSWLIAKKHHGRVVLRIDDIDESRSKQKYIDQLQKDYEYLGLAWDVGPFYQSENIEEYKSAFEKLEKCNLIYPCFCTRAQMREHEINITQAPHGLPFGQTNLCSCMNLSCNQREARMLSLASENRHPSYRLNIQNLVGQLQNVDDQDMQVAKKQLLEFDDMFQGHQEFNILKDYTDFIIKRSDGAFAYQLAVVVDDSLECVTHVVRGRDLIPSTPIQIALANRLGMQSLNYAHVPLICAPDGRRLAKRNKDAYLDVLLDELKSPKAIIGKIAYLSGITDNFEHVTPEDLIDVFDEDKMRKEWGSKEKIIWE